MRLEIQNFRCFRSKTIYEFNSGALTLLKGNSGAGKSTILESIRWCLYGSLRNIYPSGFTPSNTNKTLVSIEIMGNKITRSQAPEQLSIITSYNNQNSITLTQEAAQKYIDGMFGNKDVWLASSFIRQNERCPLITASNSERMSLLNEILFGNDITTPYENPDFYVEKIEDELDKVSKEITGKTAIFNNCYNKYMDLYNSFENVYNWENMSSETVEQYRAYIEELKLRLDIKSKELINISNLENQKKYLREKLLSLNDVREVKEETINELNIKLSNIQTQINKVIQDKTKYDSLQKELDFHKSNFNVDDLKLSPSVLENEIKNLKNEIYELEKKAFIIKTNETKKQNLALQIESNTKELLNNETQLQKYTTQDVDMLKQILNNSIIYESMTNIQNKINTLNLTELTNEEDIVSFEKKYQSNYIDLKYSLQVCQKYNVQLNEITERIENYRRIIEFDKIQKQHLNNKKLYDAKTNELNKLKNEIITFDKQQYYIENDMEINEINIKALIENIQTKLGSPLKCPKCDCTLEYNNGVLTVPNFEIIDKSLGLTKIQKLKELLNIISRNNSVQNLINKIENEISLIEPFDTNIISQNVYSEIEIRNIQTFIDECSRIQTTFEISNLSVLEEKISNLKKCIEYHKYVKEFNELNAKFNSGITVRNDLSELRNEIAVIPMLISNIERIRSNIDKLNIENQNIIIDESYESINTFILCKKEELKNKEPEYTKSVQSHKTYELIRQIESRILEIDVNNISVDKLKNIEQEKIETQNSITELRQMLLSYKEYLKIKSDYDSIILITSADIIQNEIDTLNENLKEYSNMHTKSIQMLNLVNDRNELEKIRDEVVNITNKQSNLNILKSIIVETSNNALQNLVDSINNSVNNILEELFDNGIIVELKLYKEIKTKQKSKPCVNIEVYVNGNSYDINALSGGERDRISMAFTIALACIHSSPIVLLDECLSSLNLDLKADSIDVIKKYLIEQSNKLVLNIEHANIEGLYNEIVEVNP